MAKIPRREFPGAHHHLFGRGNRKQPIFADDDDCQTFLNRVLRYQNDHGIVILAYCLMINHYHMAVESRIGQLSRFMKRLSGSYTRLFNDRHGTVGHVFQGPFGNRICTSDADLKGTVRYVHMNPVEARLAPSPALWRWSSHKGILAGHDPLAHVERTLELFGGKDAYGEFMNQPGRAEKRGLEEIARTLFGAQLAKVLSPSRDRDIVAARRDFVVAAMLEGHRPSALARYLRITPAAVTYLLKKHPSKT